MSLYDDYLKESQKNSKSSSGGLYQQYLKEQNAGPGFFSTVYKNVKSALFNKPEKTYNPVRPSSAVSFGKNVAGGIGDAFSTGIDSADKAFADLFDSKKSGVDKGVSMGKGLLDTAYAVVSPVTSVMAEAGKVKGPGGDLATGVNNIFGALGSAGSDTGSLINQNLPGISQETKDKIDPLFREIGAGLLQLGAGKLSGAALAKKKAEAVAKAEQIKEVVQQDRVAKTPEQNIAEDVRQKINYNKDLPESTVEAVRGRGVDELPFDKDGKITLYRDETPVPGATQGFSINKKAGQEPYTINRSDVVVNLASKKIGELYETGFASLPENIRSANMDALKKFQSLDSEVLVKNPPAQNKVLPDAKPAKAASDINTALVERGAKAIPEEELASYSPQRFKEQVDTIATMLENKMNEVVAMAEGRMSIPPNINPQILFNAVEAQAIRSNNVGLLRSLAKSPLATQLSEAAQRMSGHGFNDNPNSPISLIKSVENARLKGREARGDSLKKNIEQDVKEIKKLTPKPTKQSWSQFIDEIKCNY